MLSVMLVTTVLVSLVMLIVWEKPLWLVMPFLTFFLVLEGLYFSANIIKVSALPFSSYVGPLPMMVLHTVLLCTHPIVLSALCRKDGIGHV